MEAQFKLGSKARILRTEKLAFNTSGESLLPSNPSLTLSQPRRVVKCSTVFPGLGHLFVFKMDQTNNCWVQLVQVRNAHLKVLEHALGKLTTFDWCFG